MRAILALVLSILLLPLSVSAATINLIDGGTFDRVDPAVAGEDVFYNLAPIDLNGRAAPVTFTLTDAPNLGGSIDLLVSAFIGDSNWKFTGYRVTVDGVVTTENFGVDVTLTPDFVVPIDFSAGSSALVLLSNFDNGGGIVRTPVGYTGSNFPLLSGFSTELFTGSGNGDGSGSGNGSGNETLPPVPLPAAAWMMIAGLGMLFGLGYKRQSSA